MSGPGRNGVIMPVPGRNRVTMPVPGRNGVKMPVPCRNGVKMPIPCRNGTTMTVPGRSAVAMSGPGRNRVTMAVPVRSVVAIPVLVEMELQSTVMTTFVTLYTDPSKGRMICYVNYEWESIISNSAIIFQCCKNRITKNIFFFEQKIELMVRTKYFFL